MTNIPSADNIVTDVIHNLSDNPNESGLSAEELKTAFDTGATNIKTYLKSLKTALDAKFAAIYPVGSIYMSVNNTDPGTLFGGTWERIKDKFILSSGDTYNAGDTGGAATVTLTTQQIPAHTHGSKTLTGAADFRRYGTSGTGTVIGPIARSGIITRDDITWSGEHSLVAAGGKPTDNPYLDRMTVNATHEHTSVGGGQAHNNMPPYLAVYVWKRIS